MEPVYEKSQAEEVQLGFYFAVGKVGQVDDKTLNARQANCYLELERVFLEKGRTLFGKQVAELGTILPIGPCGCDWGSDDVNGARIYSVVP